MVIKEIIGYICWVGALFIVIWSLIEKRKRSGKYKGSARRGTLTEYRELRDSIDRLGGGIDRIAERQSWMFALQLALLGAILTS